MADTGWHLLIGWFCLLVYWMISSLSDALRRTSHKMQISIFILIPISKPTRLSETLTAWSLLLHFFLVSAFLPLAKPFTTAHFPFYTKYMTRCAARSSSRWEDSPSFLLFKIILLCSYKLFYLLPHSELTICEPSSVVLRDNLLCSHMITWSFCQQWWMMGESGAQVI